MARGRRSASSKRPQRAVVSNTAGNVAADAAAVSTTATAGGAEVVSVGGGFVLPRRGKANALARYGLNIIDAVHGAGPWRDKQIPVEAAYSRGSVAGKVICGTSSGVIGLSVNVHGERGSLMAFVHEVGHVLDLEQFGPGNSKVFGSKGEEFNDFWAAVDATPMRERILEAFTFDRAHARYLLSRPEMFARAYEQWIAIRSGDDLIRKELTLTQEASGANSTRYWSDEEFEPIAAELDKVFAARGWLGEQENTRIFAEQAGGPQDTRAKPKAKDTAFVRVEEIYMNGYLPYVVLSVRRFDGDKARMKKVRVNTGMMLSTWARGNDPAYRPLTVNAISSEAIYLDNGTRLAIGEAIELDRS